MEKDITVQSQLMARLLVVETQQIANEKTHEKTHDKIIQNITDINKKLDDIRYELQKYRCPEENTKKILDLEIQISNLKLELAESLWIKKVITGIVGLILITVASTIINISMNHSSELTDKKLDTFLEKLNNEYIKH